MLIASIKKFLQGLLNYLNKVLEEGEISVRTIHQAHPEQQEGMLQQASTDVLVHLLEDHRSDNQLGRMAHDILLLRFAKMMAMARHIFKIILAALVLVLLLSYCTEDSTSKKGYKSPQEKKRAHAAKKKKNPPKKRLIRKSAPAQNSPLRYEKKSPPANDPDNLMTD